VSSMYVVQMSNGSAFQSAQCRTCAAPTRKFAPPVGNHPKLAKFCSKICAKEYKMMKKMVRVGV
jgi:hypothetical protein